jgi:hypothetical protein
MPWQVSLGFAYQLGPRPFNPLWRDPHDVVPESAVDDPDAAPSDGVEEEREDRLDQLREQARVQAKETYQRTPRFYVLISTELVLVGTTGDAASIDEVGAFDPQRTGESLTLSPRLGIESEVVPRWVRLRGGTYGEPSRRSDAHWRVHGTLGFDLKLFEWTVFGLFDEGTGWSISAAGDVAREYLATSFSIGTWE